MRKPLRAVLLVVLVVGMASLAGCSAFGGPSVSDTHSVVVDGNPAIVFNYSVDDYATALLRSPEGNVVGEAKLEPDKNQDGIYLHSVEPGKYTVIVQTGGKTAAKKSVEFEGAKPSVQSVVPEWSSNALNTLYVQVHNSGDLPLQVQDASISARGQTVSQDHLYTWVGPNQTEMVPLSSSYGSTITVTEPGDVKGAVQLGTSNGSISGTFEKTFQGPNLTVENIEPSWSGNKLRTVTVEVKNAGDMPTSANASVEHAGKSLGTTWDKDIEAGGTATFDVQGIAYLYKVENSGTTRFDVVIDSPYGYEQESVSHTVQPSATEISSFSPVWENGNLQYVTYSVTNTGQVQDQITATVSVNGHNVASSDSWSVDPGSTEEFQLGSEYSNLYEPLFSAGSGGTYKTTLKVSGKSNTDTATESHSLADLEGSISEVSTMFLSNYDAPTSDLSSVDFVVRNSGGVTLTYDSVRVSIGGVDRTDSLYLAEELKPGATNHEYVSVSDGITVDNGQHQMTITLLRNGDAVLKKTVTVSTE